jgi:CxxC motif-containing protein
MTAIEHEGTITHYLCIECPLGCRLEVEEDMEGNVVEVRGHSCKKGEVFAKREHTDPRRMVTTTVAVHDGRWPRLPVRTTAAVPKDRVMEVVTLLRSVSVESPVIVGDVIVADIAGTGVDVVASRDMPIREDRDRDPLVATPEG